MTWSRAFSSAGSRRGSSIRSLREAPDENYSIAIPPPNVTGALHMGHALNGSIQDVLIRKHRMQGAQHQMDLRTDHAGIATQVKVEQQLAEEGKSKVRPGPRGVHQAGLGMARGVRLDDRPAVQAARLLVRLPGRALHDGRGLRARGGDRVRRSVSQGPWSTATTTWSTGTRARASAISDLEVEQRRVEDKLYSIDLSASSRGPARSRSRRCAPRTMLADTAIAVNPKGRSLHATDRRGPRSSRSSDGGPPDHRRGLRGPRVRDRRAEDHAGPRLERL